MQSLPPIFSKTVASSNSEESTVIHADSEESLIIKLCMLTTIDNPFNPFEDYDNWSKFDEDKGYNSAAYLARIAKTSDELSDVDNAKEIERAIDEITALNVLGIYRKMIKEF